MGGIRKSRPLGLALALPHYRLLYNHMDRCEQVSDGGLQWIGQLPSLTCLDLARCYHVTDEGLESLTSLSRLTSLNLTCCEQVS